jgi:hypothetical protein
VEEDVVTGTILILQQVKLTLEAAEVAPVQIILLL